MRPAENLPYHDLAGWFASRDRQIVSLRDAGCSWQKIANHFDITVTHAMKRYKRTKEAAQS